MRKSAVVLIIALLSLATLVPSVFAAPVTPLLEDAALNQACLEATVRAIELEIGRHQRWLEQRIEQGNTRDLLELRMMVERLTRERDKYRSMDPTQYVLPEQGTTTTWVQGKAGDDSLLMMHNMSKLGPFYHVAGIAGGDYGLLQPNVQYKVIMYKVYPRIYWSMDSDYVFIAVAEK